MNRSKERERERERRRRRRLVVNREGVFV